MSSDPGANTTGPRRSSRQVRAAAKLLQKEARRVLGKHASRFVPEVADALRACVAGIDTCLAKGDAAGLEAEAERLDDLLAQHASFARKGALRETFENLFVAVFIALGLRSCFYEPFKIPSGSMMPTLVVGDHIFVNKFTYGIQVPFTTRVVGSHDGDIQRGDVVVFRYPLDESEDFIKRVIGLPGDEVRVQGRRVFLKRSGATESVEIPKTPLEELCLDESGTRTLHGCDLYEETLDGHTYQVRYLRGLETRQHDRTWKVPDGHLLVMGDNRNQSHDSLAWMALGPAVLPDHLLGLRDLRDVTGVQDFEATPDAEATPVIDALEPTGRYGRVSYMGQVRAPNRDQELAVWRDPVLSSEVVFETVRSGLPGPQETSVRELLGDAEPAERRSERDRAREIGAGIDRLVVSRAPDAWTALVWLGPAKTVLSYTCGSRVCPDGRVLAMKLTGVIGKYHRDHDQGAQLLLEREEGVSYVEDSTGRRGGEDRFLERAFVKGPGPEDRVRMRAWRQPDERLDLLRDAALRAAGTSTPQTTSHPELGVDAHLGTTATGFISVSVDRSRRFVVALECGRARCPDRKATLQLATQLQKRVPVVAADWERLPDLITTSDVPGSEAMPFVAPTHYEYDRASIHASLKGPEHEIDLEVWLRPEEGVPAKLAALRATLSTPEPSDLSTGATIARDDLGFVMAFAVAEDSAVVRLGCGAGVCVSQDAALALARRVRENAKSPDDFVDPNAERPRPFVPRGHVKGRADRIWYPLPRFWLPIR